jgi:hypothetical protein
MAKVKQYVFSARTTEEVLKRTEGQVERRVGRAGHRRDVRPLQAGQGRDNIAEERGDRKGA